MTSTTANEPGTVYLVGAGPGDPGLITLRAVECLRRADVIIYDYLANPAALQHAPESAELVCLGHHSSGRMMSPDQIIAYTIEQAKNGKTVVRLKGGDPSIFGRGADECKELRAAGIPFEVVPGITAAVAAAAFCEIPITHHEGASAVALLTGHERDSKTTSPMDYGKLADFPGTLVLYMGVIKAAHWSEALIAGGKPPDTPVAIVRWCSWPKQEFIRCTLATVVQVIEQRRLRPPALFVIGRVVENAPEVSWFAARPLFGTRVLVPGSASTAETVAARLSELGAEVTRHPVTRITDPRDWAPVDAALDRLAHYDWLIFSSGNGVDYLIRRLFDRGGDVRPLGQVKLAALGASTAARLAKYHVEADKTPKEFAPQPLARTLVDNSEHRRFLLARSQQHQPVLAPELERLGAHVDQIAVYNNVDQKDPNPDVTNALSSDEIDWITVTSVHTARSLVRLYGQALRKVRLASISPMTSAALHQLGYPPALEASPHTTDGLVDAILRSQPD